MRELVDTLNHAVRVAEGKTKELNQLIELNKAKT